MFEIIQSLLHEPTFKSKVKYAIKTFKANEKILEQGKPHTAFYLIKAGKVRVSVSGNIKEKSAVRPGIADLGPNDAFGEFGLYDEEPANADVIAISESQLIVIDIFSFRTYLEENPQIGYTILQNMLNTLIKRLRHADETIVKLYTWGLKAHKIDVHLDEDTDQQK